MRKFPSPFKKNPTANPEEIKKKAKKELELQDKKKFIWENKGTIPEQILVGLSLEDVLDREENIEYIYALINYENAQNKALTSLQTLLNTREMITAVRTKPYSFSYHELFFDKGEEISKVARNLLELEDIKTQQKYLYIADNLQITLRSIQKIIYAHPEPYESNKSKKTKKNQENFQKLKNNSSQYFIKVKENFKKSNDELKDIISTLKLNFILERRESIPSGILDNKLVTEFLAKSSGNVDYIYDLIKKSYQANNIILSLREFLENIDLLREIANQPYKRSYHECLEGTPLGLAGQFLFELEPPIFSDKNRKYKYFNIIESLLLTLKFTKNFITEEISSVESISDENVKNSHKEYFDSLKRNYFDLTSKLLAAILVIEVPKLNLDKLNISYFQISSLLNNGSKSLQEISLEESNISESEWLSVISALLDRTKFPLLTSINLRNNTLGQKASESLSEKISDCTLISLKVNIDEASSQKFIESAKNNFCLIDFPYIRDQENKISEIKNRNKKYGKKFEGIKIELKLLAEKVAKNKSIKDRQSNPLTIEPSSNIDSLRKCLEAVETDGQSIQSKANNGEYLYKSTLLFCNFLLLCSDFFQDLKYINEAITKLEKITKNYSLIKSNESENIHLNVFIFKLFARLFKGIAKNEENISESLRLFLIEIDSLPTNPTLLLEKVKKITTASDQINEAIKKLAAALQAIKPLNDQFYLTQLAYYETNVLREEIPLIYTKKNSAEKEETSPHLIITSNNPDAVKIIAPDHSDDQFPIIKSYYTNIFRTIKKLNLNSKKSEKIAQQLYLQYYKTLTLLPVDENTKTEELLTMGTHLANYFVKHSEIQQLLKNLFIKRLTTIADAIITVLNNSIKPEKKANFFQKNISQSSNLLVFKDYKEKLKNDDIDFESLYKLTVTLKIKVIEMAQLSEFHDSILFIQDNLLFIYKSFYIYQEGQHSYGFDETLGFYDFKREPSDYKKIIEAQFILGQLLLEEAIKTCSIYLEDDSEIEKGKNYLKKLTSENISFEMLKPVTLAIDLYLLSFKENKAPALIFAAERLILEIINSLNNLISLPLWSECNYAKKTLSGLDIKEVRQLAISAKKISFVPEYINNEISVTMLLQKVTALLDSIKNQIPTSKLNYVTVNKLSLTIFNFFINNFNSSIPSENLPFELKELARSAEKMLENNGSAIKLALDWKENIVESEIFDFSIKMKLTEFNSAFLSLTSQVKTMTTENNGEKKLQPNEDKTPKKAFQFYQQVKVVAHDDKTSETTLIPETKYTINKYSK